MGVERDLLPVSALNLPVTLKIHWIRDCLLLCVCTVFNITGTESSAAEKPET